MKKSELLKLIETLGEEDSVNDLFVGTDVEESLKTRALTLDNFKTKAASDKEFVAYLDSLKDNHVNTVIKTMKENGTWEKQFRDVLESKYPDMFRIEDPVIKELKEKVEQMERENREKDAQLAKAQLSKDVKSYIKEQYKDFKYDVPDFIVDRFLGEDMDKSKENIGDLMSFVAETLKSDRADYFNNNNPQPGGNSGNPGDGGNPDKKMTLSEAMKYANEHPEVDINSLI